MSGKWLWGVLVAGLSAFCLAVFLTWINLEIVTYSYEMHLVEQKLDREKDLAARLTLEGQTLLAPAYLQTLAGKMDLGLPGPEQIRTWE